MARYRKRPIVIEAEQWWPHHDVEGVRYDREYVVEDADGERVVRSGPYIETLEGPLRVSPGDWIITGIAGEKYPCKDSIFRQTYEPVWE